MHTRNVLRKWLLFAIVWPVSVLLAGCQAERTAAPPLDQPQWAGAIRYQVKQAAGDVQRALEQNRQNTDAVETALREAERKLQRLVTYDLPLQEAAERCTEAYRSYSLGHKADADRQLEEVEKLLLEMAKSRSERAASEFEKPLKVVSETRLALDTMPSAPTEDFENLLRLLNLMSLKGSLVLTHEP